MIAAYVSGHGFGHATRTAEVLRVIREREADVPLGIVSGAPEWLFRRAIPGPISFRSVPTDVGLVQRDALTIDAPGTLEAWRAFAPTLEALASGEADWLRSEGARVVLADIPPLAFEAARRAGVRSIGLANFSWDWIYRHFARREPGMARAADVCAGAYASAGLLLELPFAGDLSAFPHRTRIPLVARRPVVAREEARRRLGLDARPALLLSFGGLGLPGFDADTLAPLAAEFRILADREIAAERLAGLGLRYQDVVGAVDVVVTKPGYGIVSDAIAAGTRLVYTERGDFPEYPILVQQMARQLPAAYVSNADLRRGALRPALVDVLGQPARTEPDLRGAEVAAEAILAAWRVRSPAAPGRSSRTS